MKAKRLARRVIYENPWVNLYVDRVRLPNRHVVQEFHFLDFDIEAVGVLVENHLGQILLEKIYRYTTDTRGWEIPAGGIDPGESVLAAARREVFEETGYRLKRPRRIYRYYPTNGTSNKTFHLVHAKVGPREGVTDWHEVDRLRWFSRAELRQLLRRGSLKDGMTLSALVFLGVHP